MKTLIFITALLLTSTANADTLTWAWEAPVERSDGSAFDMSSEGAGYQVMFNGVLEVDTDGSPLLLSNGANGLSKDFPAGDVCIQLATQDAEGRLSTFTEAVNNASQTACKRVNAPPNAPTNITVTITIVP